LFPFTNRGGYAIGFDAPRQGGALRIVYEQTMTTIRDPVISADRESVVNWLAVLERALVTADAHAVANMFVPDGIWRDVLALTGDLHTYCGVQQIQEAMGVALGRTRVLGLSSITVCRYALSNVGVMRQSRQCSRWGPPSAADAAWCVWLHR
jgi:hypothetical protein